MEQVIHLSPKHGMQAPADCLFPAQWLADRFREERDRWEERLRAPRKRRKAT